MNRRQFPITKGAATASYSTESSEIRIDDRPWLEQCRRVMTTPVATPLLVIAIASLGVTPDAAIAALLCTLRAPSHRQLWSQRWCKATVIWAPYDVELRWPPLAC